MNNKTRTIQIGMLAVIMLIAILPFTLALCSETDRGLDYFQKGTTTADYFWSYTDYCRTNTVQVEYYCSSPSTSTVSSEESNCGSGRECLDGKCQYSSAICSDTDGSNYKNKGSILIGNSHIYDSCDGSTVLERICEGSNSGTVRYACTNYGSSWTCLDGACALPSTPAGTCTRSSAFGLDYKTKGYITVDGTKIYDSCSGIEVLERICDGNSAGTAKYNCGNYGSNWMCSDGACVEESSPVLTCSRSALFGIDYKTKGWIEIGDSKIYDSCSGNTVLERICEGDSAGTTKYDCKSYGDNWVCLDGQCKESSSEDWFLLIWAVIVAFFLANPLIWIIIALIIIAIIVYRRRK